MRLDEFPSGVPVRIDFEFANILAPDDDTLAVAAWRDVERAPEYPNFVNGVLPFNVVAVHTVHALARPAITIHISH